MEPCRSRGRSGPKCGIAAFSLISILAQGSLVAAKDTEPMPPPGTTVVRDVQAGGVQIYACRITPAGTFAWTLVGPKAVLVNADGSDFGMHSAGPTWTAIDGSTIAADGTNPLVKIDRPQSVPALLLRVTDAHGDGVLTDVHFVRRSDTQGGVAPATGCDAEHANATIARHYSAVYTFFR